jgi:hypothetical protein
LDLKKIIKLTPFRASEITKRMRERLFDVYAIFDAIEKSKFLLGDNPKGWKVDFDFVFCSQQNYVKILEGNYEDPDFEKKEERSIRKKFMLAAMERQEAVVAKNREEQDRLDDERYSKALDDKSLVKNALQSLTVENPTLEKDNPELFKARLKYRILNLYRKINGV